MRASIRSLTSFASLFAAASLLCACPVKSECLGGTVDVNDECVCPPGTIETPPGGGSDICTAVDGGVVDAGDAGSRDAGDAGDAALVDEGVDDGGQDAGPCGMPCEGATPVCDATDGMCVECTATDLTACTAALPACVGRVCVECETSADCADTPTTSVCNPTNNTCVACNADSDCTTLAAAQCDTTAHACVPCTGNAACVGRTGTTVCGAGTCVECTAADRGGCTSGICLLSTLQCAPAGGATGLCQTCVSDAQCRAGQLCVPMTFDTPARPVGNFCLWRQDAAGTGAPGGACSAVRPYVRSATATTSIEGVSATVCSLRSTTCPALNDFSMRNCMTLDATGDALCGAMDFADGLCRMFDAAANLCTVECVSDNDCKTGSTCDTSVTPQVCLF